jgi:RimJ/RimL family protein N-acetyltransferase
MAASGTTPPTMSITLRAFRASDTELLAKWAKDIDIDQFMSRSGPRRASTRFHDPGQGLFWFVIVASGQDVGTIWLEPGHESNESILGVLLGDPGMFGHGVGTQAISLALQELWSCFPSNYVSLRVRRSNSRAIACYEKAGFVVTSGGTKSSPSGAPIHFFKMQLKERTTAWESRSSRRQSS